MGDELEQVFKNILDRTPKVQGLQHIFFSRQAHELDEGATFSVIDESGAERDANFIGGCKINKEGIIVPDMTGAPVKARVPLETYTYQGVMNWETGKMVDRYYISVPDMPVDLEPS